MMNPFVFGTMVDEPYFTDRRRELEQISQFLDSENHLIIISPRRYGKSSLVRKAVSQSGRPCVWLNVQTVLSRQDLAVKLLKAIFKQFKYERIKHFLRHFRIIPTVNLNPMTNEVGIEFQPKADDTIIIEDVLGLLPRLSTPERRLIVVLDEFQEVIELGKGIDKTMRAVMQEQRGLNYIFMGSQESMMTDIFERVKSPFYHFGSLMTLGKIPRQDFADFLIERFGTMLADAASVASEILDFTDCHPYYTQQLASVVWDMRQLSEGQDHIVEQAITKVMRDHDLDYERLWLTLNKTDQSSLAAISQGINPVQLRQRVTSTVTSSLKRLAQRGYLVRTTRYEIEDPFFSRWIKAHQQ